MDSDFRKATGTQFSVREFTIRDLLAVSELEGQEFLGDSYPTFFFVQASEIFSRSFLVAESRDGEVIGYGLGALDQSHPSIGWILSVGVSSAWRRKKVGTRVTEELMIVLEGLGAKTLLLTVEPNNNAAIILYTKLGFSVKTHEPDYFGPGHERLVMARS